MKIARILKNGIKVSNTLFDITDDKGYSEMNLEFNSLKRLNPCDEITIQYIDLEGK